MKIKLFSPGWLVIYAIVLFVVGAALLSRSDIESLRRLGYAKQEQYTYTDSDGEEHEDLSLIEIKGVGKVLTYNDVYLSAIPLLIISLILGRVIFHSRDELRCVIYSNCMVGFCLISLTTKANVVSTLLFWAGNIVAGIALSCMAKDERINPKTT